MVKELVRDEAVLSTPCEAATADDAALAQDLVDTLGSLEDAGCLAANQIGVARAMAAVETEDGRVLVMANPRLLFGLGPSRVVEGCLTREEPSTVTRHIKIKVAFDELSDGKLVPRRREFTGFTAQMVQHMIDHCAGKLV